MGDIIDNIKAASNGTPYFGYRNILDNAPTVEAISKAEYENRLKADMVVMLDKIRAEIKALSNSNPSYWHSGDMVDRDDVLEILDNYKAESENT